MTNNPLLVVDTSPWYTVPPNYAAVARDLFAPLGYNVLDATTLVDAVSPWLQAEIDSGDLIMLPLMSGALLRDAVDKVAAERHAEVLIVPSSKHPFVTLSADSDSELMESLRHYERTALGLDDTLRRLALSSKIRRVVFLDTNTARGKDALLLRRYLGQFFDRDVAFSFVVAINETTEQLAMAPGWRSGLKDSSPDVWGVRSIGHTTRYLSHMRFLADREDVQVARARHVLGRYPGIRHFWDTLSPELAAIHGHRESHLRIHREHTHVRLAVEDQGIWPQLADRFRTLDSIARPVVDEEARNRRAILLSTAAVPAG